MGNLRTNVLKASVYFNFSFVLLFLLPAILFSKDLEKREILLGGQTLTVEIADTVESQVKGLMGRTSLSDKQGMLFVYPKPAFKSFWMKNMVISISIGFFDADQKLLHTADLDSPLVSNPSDAFPTKPLPSYRSPAPILYALEVPQGWFKKKEIRIGDKFSFLDPEQ